MALALTDGLLDLKTPEPTKTPSAPSCIIRAASARGATPPAAEVTTGSPPARWDSLPRPQGGAGPRLSLGADHGRSLAEAAQGLAQVAAATDEGDFEGVLPDVMGL